MYGGFTIQNAPDIVETSLHIAFKTLAVPTTEGSETTRDGQRLDFAILRLYMQLRSLQLVCRIAASWAQLTAATTCRFWAEKFYQLSAGLDSPSVQWFSLLRTVGDHCMGNPWYDDSPPADKSARSHVMSILNFRLWCSMFEQPIDLQTTN